MIITFRKKKIAWKSALIGGKRDQEGLAMELASSLVTALAHQGNTQVLVTLPEFAAKLKEEFVA